MNFTSINILVLKGSFWLLIRKMWLFIFLVIIAFPLVAQDYGYVAQFGSYGTADGQFNVPDGIAFDEEGNIYVADFQNHRVQKFNAEGNFLAKFGTFGTENGQFRFPEGVAVDIQGNVYVTDRDNHRVQKFDAQGNFLLKFGFRGDEDGQLQFPYGIDVDAQGNVYVADVTNNRVQKFDSQGNFVAKFGTFGTEDGQFQSPYGLALDDQGNVYVVDGENSRVQKFDSQGNFLLKFGSQGTEDGQFTGPYGLAVDSQGNVYVTDGYQAVKKFNSQGTFLTMIGSEGTGDGQFGSAVGIAVNHDGIVYVSEINYLYDINQNRHRVLLFAPVSAPNTAPTLSSIGNQSGNELVSLEFQASATDDGLPNNTLTYSLAAAESGTHPEGADITAAGAFSWTPTEAKGPGTYRVKVVVSDGELSDEEEIQIQVNEVNVAPVLAAIGNKTVVTTKNLTFTISATDADIPIQVLTYSALGLPTGATFNAATRTFSWTPTSNQMGQYSITFQVSDGVLTDTEIIQITVTNPAGVKPTITSFLPPSGPVGTWVEIKGTNLLNPTKVTFGGRESTEVEGVDATTVRARVPSKAKDGTIAVKTPYGTATSGTKFTVTSGLAASSEAGLQTSENVQVLIAYPTEFSDKTTLAFSLEAEEDYVLEVFDMQGTLVKKLAAGIAEAYKRYEFELRSDGMSEGLYITRLTTASRVQSLKTILKK